MFIFDAFSHKKNATEYNSFVFCITFLTVIVTPTNTVLCHVVCRPILCVVYMACQCLGFCWWFLGERSAAT